MCSGVGSAPREMSLMATGQMVLEDRVVAACSDQFSAAATALPATFLASPPKALPEEAYPAGHSSDHFDHLNGDAEMASLLLDDAWPRTTTDGDGSAMDLDDAREG